MGTLTGNTAALPDHCIHKLPTSCRLTASGQCCACQDKRPHTTAYPTYVDGLGLVNGAPRWYRYCYYCKEFWTNRITFTRPQISFRETHIPELPDQAEFLQKWYEYHQGFKTIHNTATGESETVTITQDLPWRDVDPGYLPTRNHAEQITRRIVATTDGQETAPGASIDATLDELLESARDEDAMEGDRSSCPPDMQPGDHAIRQSIFEHRQQVVDETLDSLNEATAHLRDAEARHDRAFRDLQRIEDEVRSCQRAKATALRDHIRAQHDLRTHESQQRRNERAAQRMARIFGSREEIERAGSDYVSPITRMFTRAYERFRHAEEAHRHHHHAPAQQDSGNVGVNGNHHHVFSSTLRPAPPHSSTNDPSTGQVQRYIHEHLDHNDPSNGHDVRLGAPPRTLDDDSSRPPPMTDEEMTVKLLCKICLQQRADTAVLPCGHLVMCSHCASIWTPTRRDGITIAGRAHCCLCRRNVKRVARIYTS